MLHAACMVFLQKMYRRGPDVSTGFCRLHYVKWLPFFDSWSAVTTKTTAC